MPMILWRSLTAFKVIIQKPAVLLLERERSVIICTISYMEAIKWIGTSSILLHKKKEK